MPGWTNRGKFNVLGIVFRGVTPPINFFIALVTNASPPGPDTNTFSQLTEIVQGNGYSSGGLAVARNTTDFDVLTESDSPTNLGLVQLKDIVWNASVGGSIPASGNGARWAVLTDANPSIPAREVWKYWDLVSDRSVSANQTLTLQNTEIRITET